MMFQIYPPAGAAVIACREWARKKRQEDPTFFDTSCHVQHPEYLWIGCSDSRVPVGYHLFMNIFFICRPHTLISETSK